MITSTDLLQFACFVEVVVPYHINDKLAKTLALPLGEVLEDITVLLMQELKAHGEVVVLQN